MNRYGIGEEKFWELSGSNMEEFTRMFDRKIARAGLVGGKNVYEIDAGSEEGKKVKAEYEYFMKIRAASLGVDWSQVKKDWEQAITRDTSKDGSFFILSEEGMGRGVKLGNGDVYDDRITVFRNGKIVEFYRANVDPTVRDSSGKSGFRTSQPGVYEAQVYQRPNREKLKAFSIHLGGKQGVRMDKEYSNVGYFSWDILIHGGGIPAHGTPWNWSHGCQTIYGSEPGDDFDKFARLFAESYDEKKKEYKYYYGLLGYYFLLTQ